MISAPERLPEHNRVLLTGNGAARHSTNHALTMSEIRMEENEGTVSMLYVLLRTESTA